MTLLDVTPPVRTLGEALALRPDLAAGYRDFLACLAGDAEVDATLVERCRRRVQALVAGRPEAATPASAREAVVLELAEQLVLDPHGVGDELVRRVREHCSPRAIVRIAQAVVVFEGLARLARTLDVAPEL